MPASSHIDIFKRALLEQREQHLSIEALAESSAETVELDQNRLGRLSRMDAIQTQAMAQANKQHQRDHLKRIEAALSRIDSGHYGRCVECDELIPVARLEVDPSAECCIVCAELAEQR